MAEVMVDLNPPQRAAVTHGAGPLLVFAGAGSGKTRVITHRVAHLVASGGVRPWRVLAVTFTNKAAQEMRDRVAALLGPVGGQPWVGTFHATCARLLRLHAERIGVRKDFTIYDDSDQKAMLTRVIRDLKLEERRFAPKAVAGRINHAKQELQGPEEISTDDPYDEVVQRIYEAYDEAMLRSGALDFGDLIYRLVVAMERDPMLRAEVAGRFDHILVDEFQDTNHAQYRLVNTLSADHRNICVVGDDDQSIYAWRGADRRNILDFHRAFPDTHVVKLEQNYRSTQRILRVAHAIISRNLDREPKTLWTENSEGAPAVIVTAEDERDEARLLIRAIRDFEVEGLSVDQMAVLYRTHAQARVLEEALRAADIAYQVVGGVRFYERTEVKDLLAYLRVLHNPDDDVGLLRIINTPTRGIGKTTIGRLLDAAARGGIGVWQAMERVDENAAIKPAARKKIAAFVAMLSDLRGMAQDEAPLGELLDTVLERTGYVTGLREQDTPEADARLENMQELVGSIREFEAEAEEPTLASYLELVTLQTSADEVGTDARLTLMTVHAAKGLEFPVVIVAGLEEQMFPLRGTAPWEDPEEMEEERRLAYVAFTRAQDKLVLSHAHCRTIYGQMRVNGPSRFLEELPRSDVLRTGSGHGSAAHAPRRRSPDPVVHAALAPQPARHGEYVDYAESDLTAELHVGTRVRHAKFGVGMIDSVTEGSPPRVRVSFPGWGTKQIVLDYLEPA